MDFDFGPVEKLDTVPTQFRPLYAPEPGEDGKFTIAEPLRGAADAFVGLGRALKAERAAAKSRPAVDLSPLSEFGATPEEIATGVKTKLRELQDELAKGGKINLDKVKQEFAASHQGEVTKLKTRATALQTQLYETLVDNAARAALDREKGSAELLLPVVRQMVKVAEEDGKFSVYVTDGAGDRRFSGVTGAPMSIVELVAELKTDKRFARAFDADAPSGGGMPPGSAKSNVRPIVTAKDKTAMDKIRDGLAAGRLRKEAR